MLRERERGPPTHMMFKSQPSTFAGAHQRLPAMSRLPTLGQTLQELPGLAGLIRRARELEALDRRLRATLPAALAAECRLANLREDELVFLARSAAWASRLRLSSRRLLAEARKALGKESLRLTVKVARTDANSPFA